MHSSYDLSIVFPECLQTNTFEVVLKSNYRKSRFKNNQMLFFDFENVLFCGVFELSLISLWLNDLNNLGKNIFFNIPKSKAVYDFLNNYEFFNYLKQNNINTNADKFKKPYNPVISPMLPLRFNNQKEFRSLLEELNDKDRLNILLKDISEADIVKSNAIHTIILKELSDNVFSHTNCNMANVILTKMHGPDLRYKNAKYFISDFEYNFLARLEEYEYIILIISDYGDGFLKKLLKAYKDDNILPKTIKKNEPSEIDIIKYAFLKHSTSRSEEERKHFLPQLLSSGVIHEYPFPTGLFEVYNTAKRYQALMHVRSGKSIVCYDFLSNKDKVIVKSNEEVKKFKKLAYFPGVQYKFYFPINYPPQEYRLSFYERALFEIEEDISFYYLSINDFVHGHFNIESEKDIEKLNKIKEEITRFYIENENNNSMLIFDANDFIKINYKNIIHYL